MSNNNDTGFYVEFNFDDSEEVNLRKKFFEGKITEKEFREEYKKLADRLIQS